MKNRIFCLAVIVALTLCSCGQASEKDYKSVEANLQNSNDIVDSGSLLSEASAQDDEYEKSDEDSSIESESLEESLEESDTEEIKEELKEEEKDDVVLKFVDVFGEEYETTIKADVPKHDYLDSSFSRDGNLLTYDDNQYTSRFGIDVSKHQGKINWEKVKSQGVEFAFIRIGYRGYGKSGSINLDQRFYENIKAAQAAGIDVGVYFFSQAINEEEALEEAKFVIDSLEGYELQLPVVYDPESILDDVARTDDVSGEQFTKNTIVFCDAISENGYEPMIYSNMLWEAFNFDLSQLTEIPIWYADYEELPQTPYHFAFWQYTNEGRISGIDGAMDLDIQIMKK
jgi:GH25 family lysozyme M1 (1,4-beta-N-acetylmuramidase)